MDHHCPWIYNCVGKRNYRFFKCFLIMSVADCMFHSVVCIVQYFHLVNNEGNDGIITDVGVVYLISLGINLAMLALVTPLMVKTIKDSVKRYREERREESEKMHNTDSSYMLATQTISITREKGSSMEVEEPKGILIKGCWGKRRRVRRIGKN